MSQPKWTTRDGRALSELHPCFAIGRKSARGRIHLPVSPACNLACRFCSRVLNDWENRPGVTSRVITPAEAVDTVRRAREVSPDLRVVGIAGPGDALATPHALETFRLVKEAFPDSVLCMSTNGLMLPDRIKELIDVGLDTLTVTVNEVDPERLAGLCAGIVYKGRALSGAEAGVILIRNQLSGIRQAADAGIIVKANTVLAPRLNGQRIAEIARAVSSAGAKLYNIIPLIPRHELAGEALPTCAEIDAARVVASEYIEVFRHCQHCRADAIGVPGGHDISAELGLRRVVEQETFSHG
ncbi:MAG: radical SAM protein [Oscillospiraceae bacterium]|nr:radical SAM protein [Oscillospiraceae bacterium]